MQSVSSESSRAAGFTLIELSIVLVIIGLIVGGVLVGQDLIRAAAVRATISQIEKYNTAVNTFRGKYGALPGDLNNTTALQFNFTARGSFPGQGDGNGVIECNANSASTTNYGAGMCGEALMFWVDLTKAGLIDGSFNTCTNMTSTTSGFGFSPTDPATPPQFLPAAKLGQGNYIYVYSGGNGFPPAWQGDNINYYGLSAVFYTDEDGFGDPGSNAGLTVAQAYQIDKKTDDSYPTSGRVSAKFIDYQSGNGVTWGGAYNNGCCAEPSDTTAKAGSATTCYDNNGTAGQPQHYSMSQNSGAGVNCALSFMFQ